MAAELATPLRCSFCSSTPKIALERGRSIIEQLVELACPVCHRKGPLQLSPFAPARRAGAHEPEDIGDEQLLARRIR